MKSRFPGYYGLTDAERGRLWTDAEFVLDASVLLKSIGTLIFGEGGAECWGWAQTA